MNIIPFFIRRRIAHRPNLLRILENTGWLFLDKILRMGAGLIVGVWFARYLGPEQFGLLSFAISFVGLFGTIAGLGLHEVVVRDIVCDPNGKEETLGTAAVLQFTGGLFAYGLALGTIFWLRPDEILAKSLVSILGAMMLFRASDVAVYWFEAQVESKYTVWEQNGTFLVFAAIKVALILNNAPMIAFAWAIMVEGLIVAMLMLVVLGLHGPTLRQLRITCARAKGMIVHSWPLLLSGIAIIVYMKIDQIMLGQMVGNEAVGIYSAAVRISEVCYLIPMAIIASVFPAILEAKKRGEAQYYERLQKLFDIMVWLSLGAALPMTFLSTPIITLLFGDAFVAAGAVLAIHIWAAVFVFLGVASRKWILAENREILSFQRAVVGMITNVVLNFLLIPEYGPIGAAVATVVSQANATIFVDLFQKETRKIFYMKINAMNIFASLRRLKRQRELRTL